jgi:hypothetical protein
MIDLGGIPDPQLATSTHIIPHGGHPTKVAAT